MLLSERDRRIAERLLKFGVFEKINGKMIDQRNGLFCIVCSDGDQFDDLYRLHVKLMLEQRETPRPHMFSDHGKPLWIAEHSPLNKRYRGDNLLESIQDVPGIKEINVGVIHSHAPCAAATKAGLDIFQQVAIVKAGISRIRNNFPHITMANFFQVDNGEQKSFRVNGILWREFLLSEGFSQEELQHPEEIVRMLLKKSIPIQA